MTTAITKVMEMKRQACEPQTFRFIQSKPISGYITSKDLIDLSLMKLDLFPDYADLENKLQHMKAVRKGYASRFTVPNSPSKPARLVRADDPMNPISYSNVNDLHERFTLKKGLKKQGGRFQSYAESFENEFFTAIQEKHQHRIARQEMAAAERENQVHSVKRWLQSTQIEPLPRTSQNSLFSPKLTMSPNVKLERGSRMVNVSQFTQSSGLGRYSSRKGASMILQSPSRALLAEDARAKHILNHSAVSISMEEGSTDGWS